MNTFPRILRRTAILLWNFGIGYGTMSVQNHYVLRKFAVIGATIL
jgi:hypothetical protein